MLRQFRDGIGRRLAWITISIFFGGLMLRDLWKYGELRGGHVWRPWGEGEKFCVICGARNNKVGCREFALR